MLTHKFFRLAFPTAIKPPSSRDWPSQYSEPKKTIANKASIKAC